jgi:polygalacturonase
MKNIVLNASILFAVIILFSTCQPQQQSLRDETTGYPKAWNQVGKILSRIVPPEFPGNDFSISDYGAIGDGKVKNTEAFKQAIAACHAAGGGRVVVPGGDFLTGPIHLKSNVNLYISKGAKIMFSTETKDFLPLVFTRNEGIELMNYSPLIYAFEQSNIAITGEGILDGQASRENWWSWVPREQYGWKNGLPNHDKAQAELRQMAEDGVPVEERVFGEGSYLRPNFIQPYRCENVLIQGVTILNSPMWVINPVLCTNVTVDGVTVNSMGPNSDGCNPESSRYVLIQNCSFNNGDDCIAIKSGRDADGRRVNVPSEYIVIRNCTMANGNGGVVIGSETSGSIRHVYAEECHMSSPRLHRALRIKSSSRRGGTIEDIYYRNIEVGRVNHHVIHINMLYGEPGEFFPQVRNIFVDNLIATEGSQVGIYMKGIDEHPIKDIYLRNISIYNAVELYDISNTEGLHFENVMINDSLIRPEQVNNFMINTD